MVYQPPLDRLLTYGSVEDLPAWPNYLSLGLNAAHVPELIRMALDEQLHDSDEGTRMWAPVHAFRALGQLRAVSAAEPLIALFQRIDEADDDWIAEQLPVVYGMLGEPAIPVLSELLADPQPYMSSRLAAVDSLLEIVQQHPHTRAAVVAMLTRQLERFVENNVALNGWLVAALVELKAVESAPVIEQAFTFNRVDPMITGDWEEVQVQFGLKAGRSTPPPSHARGGILGSEPETGRRAASSRARGSVPGSEPETGRATPRDGAEWDQLVTDTAPETGRRLVPVAKDKQKANAKRKQVKQSRKKNR